jgi:hypothetical protein
MTLPDSIRNRGLLKLTDRVPAIYISNDGTLLPFIHGLMTSKQRPLAGQPYA